MQQNLFDLWQRSNLSATQLNLWLGQQRHPHAPIYNMAHTFTLHGSVDVPRFREAFQLLVERCDSLRIVITEEEGVPRQLVREEFESAVDFVDLSQAPGDAYAQWIAERCQRMLDLARRTYDSVLLKVDEEIYVWYYNQHHLTCDMLSIELVYGYLAQIYAALGSATGGQRSVSSPNDFPRDLQAKPGGVSLPEVPSFSAQVERERNQKLNENAARYWQSKFTDPWEPSDFYGRSTVTAGPETERIRCAVGADRSAQLKKLAEDPTMRALTPQLSLMNIWTALLATTLHRISGSDREQPGRTVIGAPFHNRPTPTAKRTPGLFVQLYPLIIDFDESETFRTLIPKVMKEAISSLRFAPYFSQVSEHLTRFDVVLNYLTANFQDFAGMPTDFEWIHPAHGDANHALRVQVHDFQQSGEFELFFDINVGVFDEQSRAWIVRHFLTVLDAFLANPDGEIGNFSLLTPNEEQAHLVEFNRTATGAQTGLRVLDLFEKQVSTAPDRLAVVDGNRSLTYAQLNHQATQLAESLRSHGVGPNKRVAFCTRRSLETLVAILGIHKAGGAYVPLDPTSTADRIAQILDDVDAPVILTQSHLRKQFLGRGRALLVYDENNEEWCAEETSVSKRGTTISAAYPSASDLGASVAYVIFTSGSTGRPKGTLISQKSLTNYVSWAAKSYVDHQPLAFPLYSSLAFDLTVTSIFVPLICGGKIVVYPEDDGPNDLAIVRVLQENVVDVIKLTPAHLSLLNEMRVIPSRVRTMIVGGEDFKTHLALRTLQLFGGDLEIYNEYGPTEATVGCMIHCFDPSRDTLPSVPIGRPADNMRIYVVDRYGNPVPTGVTGEMVIEGHGVALGYLNRPELTAAKFTREESERLMPKRQMSIPSAHSPVSSTRQYRTGDLARWRSTRQLEFRGRLDHQVKLRGYRVELGEIEAALQSHPQVNECVVTLYAPPEQTRAEGSFEDKIENCTRCGLPSNHPHAELNEDGICRLCRGYLGYKGRVQSYFKERRELDRIAAEMRAGRRGKYDCLVLMSGGKDSTYVLCQLVEMGLNPLAFTLDNGYISDQAKTNIRGVAEHLGVDTHFETTPHMNAIFVDSLKRYCNVCNGCFKTIYTLSMQFAYARGIRYIVTGLARGQLFETRLSEELFLAPAFDVERIDRQILEARMAYHRQRDLISERLNGAIFVDDDIFEKVEFIDFFRYSDVSLTEMLAYLAEKVPWIRPEDTGRSTNCLINDVGIYVHQSQRGFHNYALPYSWDVRLGHKERDAALAELDDEIDEQRVYQILDEIGYDRKQLNPQEAVAEPHLVAYYVAEGDLSTKGLRTYLQNRLPVYLLPSDFIKLEQLPLTSNGKIDRSELPNPLSGGVRLDTTAPESELEHEIASIWCETLQKRQIGIHANFFDLGGTSLPAIQIVARVSQHYEIDFPLRDFFAAPTISGQSARVEEILLAEIEAMSEAEAEVLVREPLTHA